MKTRIGTSALALAGLLCVAAASGAPRTPAEVAQAKKAFNEMRLQLKSGANRKLGSQLTLFEREARAGDRRVAGGALNSKLRALLARDGYISVSAYPDHAAQAASLRSTLVSKGMLDAKVRGNAVTGRVPISALADIANAKGLRFLRPALAMTRAGLVTSQGDRSMRTDAARQRFGVTGKGVRVGVMSDSYNCAPGAFAEGQPFTTAQDDMQTGDLPRDVLVLKDLSDTPSKDCADEGRAIMQIIHDVAPGSSLAFYTAFESAEDFSAGITALADAGSNIIVDDVIYFAEPMFLDGPIALAGEEATSRGIAFFSSAGNDARQSYESRFRNSGLLGLEGGPLHDFDPRKGVDPLQSVTAQAGSISLLSFQWDQPWFSVTGGDGSASDVDTYFVDSQGVPIEMCTDDPDQLVCQFPGLDPNLGDDAVEIPVMINLSDQDLQVQLAVEVFEGSTPHLIKYVYFDLGPAGVFVPNEFDTQSGTAYGHTNGAHIEAVGAAPWYNTEEFGLNKPECKPACLELFSSAGGVPILFDHQGRRLAHPQVRLKPGVTGPDGGNTTFFFFEIGGPIPGTDEPDGFPNFFGTSASAPHVAAIGALMLEKRQRDLAAHKHVLGTKQLSPDEMYWALRLSAQDMRLKAGRVTASTPIPNGRGFDFDSGFGFVDAVRAIRLISRPGGDD